ncbi:MAG: decaprenyl-phosphate phosphoribosyltransferase [Planctomycetota bacterium]
MLLPSVQALRPHQWVKNLLVLAPLLFFTPIEDAAGTRLADPTAWLQALGAFATFCLTASGIYVLNDLVDREEDRRHPKKRLRPIASGAVPPRAAAALLVAVWGLALAIAWLTDHGAGAFPDRGAALRFAIWPAAYLALNLLYSFWWKRVVIVDCMCIAIGFQIRVEAGAAAIAVETSHWIALCTFFFALFLAFCKRYEEVGRQTDNGAQTRATMRDYSEPLLNMIIGPLAALSILTYALYTVAPDTIARHHTDALMYTVPVVSYGVFRYLFLVYRRSEGGDPSRLLFRDLPLVVSGIVYLGLVLVLLHGRSA